MKKLLRRKDILLLTLAGMEEIVEEIRDPLHIMSSAYKNMYGFIPHQYTRKNFSQAVWRSIKTGDIERVVMNNNAYLRLTTAGKDKIHRDFPLTKFSKYWNKKWVILIFDIEEKSRKLRDILRLKLKNIGFGMLQQSVWITPLPIAKDMMEFIESSNLKECVFILEVSSVLLGNPKELARKVWDLDKIEEKQVKLGIEKEDMKNYIKNTNGRIKKGDIEEFEIKKKELKKKQLELVLSLPFLFKELLPEKLGKLL